MDVHSVPGDRRLLLVEDDAELRSTLLELLQSDGFDVVGTSNGSEALEYLRRSPPPDVILLDLMMPVKDGWQFRIEQKQDPALSGIPVVAMSADETAKAAAIDAEIYLKKPFDYPKLLACIDRVIENKRLAHLERMASLGTLAAGIAHEINNPLTYVIANLTLLEEEIPRLFQDCLTPASDGKPHLNEAPGRPTQLSGQINRLSEIGNRLREALEGSERIRGIVLNVKTFSRAGDDHRTLLDVRSVLDSSIKVVFSEIRQRARLIKEYKHTPLVYANPGHLGQVFLNLFLNAAHAIPEGDPHKNIVRVSTCTAPSGHVVIEISDTGQGIPSDVRHRIFDPFFTTKPVGVGTGLGLSICHGIVTSLGGRISLESELGRGSTFQVVLPAAAEAETPVMTTQVSSVQRGRVLVIDDEPKLAGALKAMLDSEHDTSVVTSGEQGLEVLLGTGGAEFDMVLCDLHMPGMTGMDLYEHVHRHQPEVAGRMVFMTGGAFSPRSREFLSSVSNPVVDKPFDLQTIRNIFSGMQRKRAGGHGAA